VRKVGIALSAAMVIFCLSACQREEGPGEKAGKEVDKAAKEAGQAMEKAADSLKDAIKKDSP